MLFTTFNFTPKGQQLLELKGNLESIKVGKCILNTSTVLDDISVPSAVAAKTCVGTGLDGLVSAHFAGFHQDGKSLQMNIRFHAPKTLASFNGKLRLVVMANEDISVSENSETNQPIYKVSDKLNGTVLGYADVIETTNAWTSTSNKGFDFSAVITVLGKAEGRCDFKQILSDPLLSGAQITAADVTQHDVSFPSLTQPSTPKTEQAPAAAPSEMEKRKELS